MKALLLELSRICSLTFVMSVLDKGLLHIIRGQSAIRTPIRFDKRLLHIIRGQSAIRTPKAIATLPECYWNQ